MPYTTSSGPPELDATHAWAPATGAAPPVLNDQGSVWPPATPWIKVDRIPGWRTLPESDDHREAKTLGPGEVTYPGEKLGKTVVYECRVLAKTRETVADTLNAIIQGYGTDMSGEGTMTVTPYVVPGGPMWTFKARVIALEPDPAWSYSEGRFCPFWWPFTLSLRMSDPFFYSGGSKAL